MYSCCIFSRIDKWDCIWRLRWANFKNDLCRLYNASQQHISQRYLRLSSQRFIRHLWRCLQRTRNGQFQLVTSTQNQRANTTVRKYTTILCILIESSSRINLVLWSWYKSQFHDPIFHFLCFQKAGKMQFGFPELTRIQPQLCQKSQYYGRGRALLLRRSTSFCQRKPQVITKNN